MPLRYTDEVPTMPGWYWCRWRRGPDEQVKIMHLPHMGTWPDPWREHRRKAFAVAAPDMLEMLKALPESDWLKEYAGPIPAPEELIEASSA